MNTNFRINCSHISLCLSYPCPTFGNRKKSPLLGIFIAKGEFLCIVQDDNLNNKEICKIFIVTKLGEFLKSFEKFFLNLPIMEFQ